MAFLLSLNLTYASGQPGPSGWRQGLAPHPPAHAASSSAPTTLPSATTSAAAPGQHELQTQALQHADRRAQANMIRGLGLQDGAFASAPILHPEHVEITDKEPPSEHHAYTKTFALSEARHTVTRNGLTMDIAGHLHIPAFGLQADSQSHRHAGHGQQHLESRTRYFATYKKVENLAGYQLNPYALGPEAFHPDFLHDLETLGADSHYNAQAVVTFLGRYGDVFALTRYYGAYQFWQVDQEMQSEEDCQAIQVEMTEQIRLAGDLEAVTGKLQESIQWTTGGQNQHRKQQHQICSSLRKSGGSRGVEDNLKDCRQAFAQDPQAIVVTHLDGCIRLDHLIATYLLGADTGTSGTLGTYRQAYEYLSTYFEGIHPTIVPTAECPVRLRNLKTQRYLCRQRSWDAMFPYATQRSEDGEINKVFKLYSAGLHGLYYIFSAGPSGFALNVKYDGRNNGNPIVSFPHWGQRNEMFYFCGERRGGEECFQIVSASCGKALDVALPYHDGAKVHTWDPHDGDSQRWVIEAVETEEDTP